MCSNPEGGVSGVGHAVRVTFANMSDPVVELRGAQVLTGPKFSHALSPSSPTTATVAECQPGAGFRVLKVS